MRLCLDVVDLLQLQEIWSSRPIVTAFSRLEGRPTLYPLTDQFGVDDLIPRLSRLKRSPAWLARRSNLLLDDPARIPLGDLPDDYLMEMYPDAASPINKRASLFASAYTCYLVADYKQAAAHTALALELLARVRHIDTANRLTASHLPAEGSPEWIPLSITDEIRGLDDRYDAAEPGSPAAYVVAEDFWTLLLKAEAGHIDAVSELALEMADPALCGVLGGLLRQLTALAHIWYRSPSLVALCYMQHDSQS